MPRILDDPLRTMHRTDVPGIYRRGGRFVVVFHHGGRQRKRSFRTMDDAVGFKRSNRIEVELPVCPLCRRTGKFPGSFKDGVFWCQGSLRDGHRRTRMELRTFVQINPLSV